MEKSGGHISIDEAARIVAAAEAAFGARDLKRALALFNSDVIVRFADFPEMRGIGALEEFLHRRFTRQRGYALRKIFRAVTGNVVADEWTGTWIDDSTGKRMHGRGMEFLTMRDGRVAIWDAVFNVWEEGAAPSVPIT